MTQESMMARFHALVNEGSEVRTAITVVGTGLCFEIDRVKRKKGAKSTEYAECKALLKWWDEVSPSLYQN